MKRAACTIGPAVLLVMLISFAPPASSQARRSTLSPHDLAREVTVNGTVAIVSPASPQSSRPGAHLILQTSSGALDVTLTRFALRGRNALPLSAGKQVQATGVMRSSHGLNTLLVRTLQIDGRIFTLRSARGIAIRPAHPGSHQVGFIGGAQ